jgi:hypothetical protein
LANGTGGYSYLFYAASKHRNDDLEWYTYPNERTIEKILVGQLRKSSPVTKGGVKKVQLSSSNSNFKLKLIKKGVLLELYSNEQTLNIKPETLNHHYANNRNFYRRN